MKYRQCKLHVILTVESISLDLGIICYSECHIGKLMGKIALIAEMHDHGEAPNLSLLDNEVMPGFLIFVARLANGREINLEQAFINRTAVLKKRFLSQNNFYFVGDV